MFQTPSKRRNVAIRNLFLHSVPTWWTSFSDIQHGLPESSNCSERPRPENRSSCYIYILKVIRNVYFWACSDSPRPENRSSCYIYIYIYSNLSAMYTSGPRSQRKPKVFYTFGSLEPRTWRKAEVFKVWANAGLLGKCWQALWGELLGKSKNT